MRRVTYEVDTAEDGKGVTRTTHHGYFHQWFSIHETIPGAMIPIPVAIVESELGNMVLVRLVNLKFTDQPL